MKILVRTIRKNLATSDILVVFLCVLISTFFFVSSVASTNRISLGIIGEWNKDFGEINDVRIDEKGEFSEAGKVYYAYCASTKGFVVFEVIEDTKKRSLTIHNKSFIPLGNCYSITLDILTDGFGNKEKYAFLGGFRFIYIIQIGDPELPMYKRSCETSSIVYDIAISGHYAYVASQGLEVIDINDPASPIVIGGCDYFESGWINGVTISENYAYVAARERGLMVLDISNPANPEVIGACDTPGNALAIAISGNYGYVADDTRGIHVIDINDPNNPILIEGGGCDTPGNALKLAISRDYIYVADGPYGLQIIDKRDPIRLVLAGSCETPLGLAKGIDVSGSYAFIAGYSGGLQVIDITSKKGLSVAENCNTLNKVFEVAISGDYAYVADGKSGILVLDIKDMNNPMLIGTCNTLGTARSIIVLGNYAYVADGESGIGIVDITDPTNPILIDIIETPGNALEVIISGKYAFVADGDQGIHAIDISDPNKLTVESSCNTPGNAMGIDILGEHLYVADKDYGLQVIDISNPNSLVIKANCHTPGLAIKIAVSRDYAYIADYESGLQIIDIKDPNLPIVGNYDTPGNAFDIAISNGYAYIADEGDGNQVANSMYIVDISDPQNPAIKNSYATRNFATGISISGDYAFIAEYNNGFEVIDISNPPDAQFIVNSNLPGLAQGIALSEGYAYIANGVGGIQVIDIHNPHTPVLAGISFTPGYPSKLTVSGGYVYYTYETDYDYYGLGALDKNDPTGLIFEWEYITECVVNQVAVSDNYAYLAEYDSGVEIIDIKNPKGPVLAGRFDTPGYAYGIAIKGSYAYIADLYEGLQVADISDPNNPNIVGNWVTPGLVLGVNVSGGYAYVAEAYFLAGELYVGICILDIRNNPTEPILVGKCYIDKWALIDLTYNIAIEGDYAYLANGGRGIYMIDIREPTHPVLVKSCNTDGYASQIVVSGDHAYIADGFNGLAVIDIGEQLDPMPAGDETEGFAHEIALSGGYAYIAYGSIGLEIIDIRDPSNPVMTRSIETLGSTTGVVISGDYAYVAAGSGIHVLHINDPANPVLVGHSILQGHSALVEYWDFPYPLISMGIAISGHYAYVLDYELGIHDSELGFQVIDISNPNEPFYVTSVATQGLARGIAVKGDYLYVADDESGIEVFRIKGPNDPDPVFERNVPITGKAWGTAISESYLFVAGGTSGLQVFNITDPALPVLVGNCVTQCMAQGVPFGCLVQGVTISESYAYIANSLYGGIQVIDICDPNNPLLIGGCDTPGKATAIAISGSYAYVADGESGMQIIRIDREPSPRCNLILTEGGTVNQSTNPYFQATQIIANKIYNTFIDQEYEACDIYYLNPIFSQDTDNDGTFNPLVVDDPIPSKKGLEYSLKDWAVNSNFHIGPLYIYLIGHGAQDRFQIMPNEILDSSELRDYIDILRENYLADPPDPNTTKSRPIVVILEATASGSFIDDLVPEPGDASQDIIVITSTGYGGSYTKPSPYPEDAIPISFTSLLMQEIDTQNYRFEDYKDKLKDAFIDAREQLYYTYGHPFLDQAPQMYVPKGPIALTFTHDDPNIPVNPFIITKREALRVVARYPDGNTITLDPRHLNFFSSQSLVFDTNDPSQMEIDSNQILVLPGKNGLTTLIAYPDPDYYPNILLTARLPLKVSIPGNTPAGGDKAIIVAGYRTNNQGMPDSLWENTNTIANHAYKTLRKKGYGKEDIFYLSPHLFQDIDGNKMFDDDIYGHPTIENLNRAFEDINGTGSQELFIFLVDHGEKGLFHMNPCSEGLNAEFLGNSILSLAPSVKGNINILIDACYSGSFTLPEDQLFLNQGEDPNDVILITSAGEDEYACFQGDGIVSFSYPFFDKYLLTNSIQTAFDHARFTISPLGQSPSLCTPGRAKKRDEGLVYYVDDARPVITQREYTRGEGKLSLMVRVYSLSGIKRVWAIILSSDQDTSIIDAGPMVDAPIIELSPDDPNNPDGGWYRAEDEKDLCPDAFNYQIFLCAQDKNDKVTYQRTNISNRNKDATGVIIIVTDPEVIELITDPEITEEDKAGLTKLFDEQSNQVYSVLKDKGIKDDDIYYLKVTDWYSEVDGEPNLDAVQKGIPSWLDGKDYDILLVYLLGKGNPVYLTGQEEEPSYVSFCLNQKEDISPEELGNYIHTHTKEGCRVIFFCDISYARAFIEKLPWEDSWTGIASTENKNWCKSDVGFLPLFSELFFNNISSHFSFGEAYDKAVYTDVRNYYHKKHNWHQNPCVLSLDPNGNLTELSRFKIIERLNFYIGDLPASGEYLPLIKTAQAWEEGDKIKIELRIKGSAMILPPQADFITPSGGRSSVSLVRDTEDPSCWRSYIQEKDQSYSMVILYVQQLEEGGQAGPSELMRLSITRASRGSEADIYEGNDQLEEAWPIVVNNPAQTHTFHTDEDTDWVYFFGHAGHQYDIRANDVTECDRLIKLSLTDPNENILTSEKGIPTQSPYCRIPWPWQWCMQDGYYYLKAEPASEYPAEGISYTLSVEENQAVSSDPNHGQAAILGRVADSNQEGVNGVRVNLISSGQIIRNTWTGSLQNIIGNRLEPSKIDGWYFIPNIEPGVYALSFTEDDPNVILKEGLKVTLNSNEVERIKDIIIDFFVGEKDVLSEFYLAYTQYQNKKGKDYPVWEDNDNDGLTNLEEFLDGTDPDDPPILWDMDIPGGWSMISVPLIPENASVSELFPEAEVVYAYEKGEGYKRIEETEELKVGRGYWILLKEENHYPLRGRPVYSYTLSVNEDGWEMIGGCISSARINTDSCDIGIIYRFIMGVGYQRVLNSEDLEPGKGYWILLKNVMDQCELIVEVN